MNKLDKFIKILFPNIDKESINKFANSLDESKYRDILELFDFNLSDEIILKEYSKTRNKNYKKFHEFEVQLLNIVLNYDENYSQLISKYDQSKFPDGIQMKNFDFELLMPMFKEN